MMYKATNIISIRIYIRNIQFWSFNRHIIYLYDSFYHLKYHKI